MISSCSDNNLRTAYSTLAFELITSLTKTNNFSFTKKILETQKVEEESLAEDPIELERTLM
jgi:hypothetical protein